MLPLSELLSPFGVSVVISTALITAAVCTTRGNYVHSVQVSLLTVLGHFMSQIVLAFFPHSSPAELKTLISAVVTLAFNALSVWLGTAVPEGIAKDLDNNDILTLFVILFALFEAYQVYLFVASVSENIRSFLERKVHLTLNQNAALPYFAVVFIATIAGYAVSVVALTGAYRHISSVATWGDDGTLHIMAIAAVAGFSVVVTALSYSTGGIGVQFSVMITLYASLMARKGAFTVKAISVPESGFTKVLTRVAGTLSRAFGGDKPSVFVKELGMYDMAEVALHVVAVLTVVLCPQGFMRRRIKWENSMDVVLMRALVSSLVLLGLMSTLIASLAIYTNTKEPSYIWRYAQCAIVLIAGINYATN